MELKFNYGKRELYLSHHAADRMFQRAGCRDIKEVSEKTAEIINNGFAAKIKLSRGTETVIAYKDFCIHIRENTITTVKYNNAYFCAA